MYQLSFIDINWICKRTVYLICDGLLAANFCALWCYTAAAIAAVWFTLFEARKPFKVLPSTMLSYTCLLASQWLSMICFWWWTSASIWCIVFSSIISNAFLIVIVIIIAISFIFSSNTTFIWIVHATKVYKWITLTVNVAALAHYVMQEDTCHDNVIDAFLMPFLEWMTKYIKFLLQNTNCTFNIFVKFLAKHQISSVHGW